MDCDVGGGDLDKAGLFAPAQRLPLKVENKVAGPVPVLHDDVIELEWHHGMPGGRGAGGKVAEGRQAVVLGQVE